MIFPALTVRGGLLVKPLYLPFVFLLMFSIKGFAAGGGLPVGAVAAGMGRCSVALNGVWSIQNNQAGLASISNITLGLNYGNRFLIKETGINDFAVVVPTKYGVAGLSLNYFGFNLYNEIKAGLSYGRSFGKFLRIGLQLDYLQIALGENYGKKPGVTFELGVQSDITGNLTLGFWTYNPVMIRLAGYADERIPAIFRLGFAYRFSDWLITTVEAEKRTDYMPVTIRGGMEYSLKRKFLLRAGFGTGEEIFSMGFGLKLKRLTLDIAAVMHNSLGFSPEMGLTVLF